MSRPAFLDKLQKSLMSASIVILAAGKGTRMKSRLPKVLHEVANRPMLGHVLAAAAAVEDAEIVVVLAPGMEAVQRYAEEAVPGIKVAVQDEARGTGHAVRAALPKITPGEGPVVVVFGDTPLVPGALIARMAEQARDKAAVVVSGFRTASPTGYGRLVTDDSGALKAIVEEKDASAEQRKIELCNGGAMAIAGAHVERFVGGLNDENASGEIYLTDVVALANADGRKVAVEPCTEEEVLGVNSRADLARAEALMQARLRAGFLADGVTMLDPSTVYLSADTVMEPDVTLCQNVVIGPGVRIASGARIEAFCHLEGASIAGDAIIGPFARLRPGAEIGRKAKIGNFVEVKKSTVGEGAKANHLAYLGDATIGAGSNIGAGTITCNYDGYRKHRTTLGEGVFVGSNSSLVAPITIEDGAYVAAGSVVTKSVSKDALGVARARQSEISGWAATWRAKNGDES